MGVEPSCFDRVVMLVFRQMECKSQPRLLLQPQFDHCVLLDAPSLWKRYIDTPKLQKAIHQASRAGLKMYVTSANPTHCVPKPRTQH